VTQSFFQGLQAELNINAVGQSPRQNVPAEPVHHGHQRQVAVTHRDVRDVGCPGTAGLHRQIVDHLLNGKHPEADPKFKFVHLMDEVHTGMNEKTCQLAILVMPAQIDHVQAISEELERMPPKSTFFYPKLLSGLVFNPLS
jgi:uncharacterized protein (DUF1015 family)